MKGNEEAHSGVVGWGQTWDSVKPGVPKEVKGGYPETKILRVG